MANESAIAPPVSFLNTLNYGFRLWCFKSFVTVGLGAIRMIRSGATKAVAPTYTKIYDVRPMLENRVFIPSKYAAGTKLPLYIDIHGGGFALCDPQTDDKFCHQMANTHGFCVVSINYRKAPTVAFPELVHDAGEIAKAVLADPDLPIDHTKVAGGGFSAGGNLILAISQMDGLQGKIHAVVPVYPVVDFSGTYKGTYRTMPDGTPDMLQRSSAWFNWGYITPGQDRSNPLMSPIYALKEDLPPKMFFIGAEYDYLCHEAEVMAKKLAGIEGGEGVPDSSDWTKNGIKWKMVKGVQHGFTHVEVQGEKAIQQKKLCDELYSDIAKWLTEDGLA